jgi:hypothetical protein
MKKDIKDIENIQEKSVFKSETVDFSKSLMVSGNGQHHTAKQDAKRPVPYNKISLNMILDRLKNPVDIDKKQAPWAIPSLYINHDSRVHEVQRNNGAYCFLWADLDELGTTTLSEVQERFSVFLPNVTAWFYTTKSATLKKMKCRIIIPLEKTISGTDFELYQRLLNDRLELAGLIPDRASERAGQLCYLPNKGEFYEHLITEGNLLNPCEKFQAEKAELEKQADDLEELARKAPKPPRQANHEQSGIIDKVNSQYNIEETLLSHGYKKSGNRFINPESKSGNAGGVILNGRYFSHNSTDIFNDGHSHDAFDVICKLKYDDDTTRAIRELAPMVDAEGQRERQNQYMQEQEQQTAELFSSQSISVEAQKLADRIKFRIDAKFKAIGVEGVEIPDIEIKPEVIEKIISNTVFSGVKNKFTVISPNGSTSYFTEKDILKFAQKIYGKFYKSEILNKKFDELGKKIDAETKKRISAIPSSVLIDFLKLRQRDDGAWSLDMFADHNRMAFTEDRVNIILCHKPFPQHGTIEPEIIGDYKKHFQEIDEVLKFLVMSVFIPDRKKSYLWIKADSDWGKGFFYSVLKDLNLAVELSVPLVQKIFKGDAVALSPSHFKRSFAIIIDEFRSIKPELKQLQSQITISPKWLMQQDVAIYSKLFFSAEGVEALTGGGFGIEDQFANRFSYIEKAGALNTRDVFKKVGMYRYKKTVLAYTAKFLNEKIKDMQALGPQRSADVAEQWINKFYAKNCISKRFGRMSEQLPRLADEIRDFYIARHKNFSSVNQIDSDVVQGTAGLILLNPAKAIDDYIAENIAYSDRAKFSKKKSELYQLMSADGRGARTQRLNEEKTKYGVLIEKRKNLASLELVK